ncbi:MAG: protein kinase domain-containing protein, partial [Mycobacterium leprae]
GDPALTRTGEIVGSPAYMSPERARGAPLGPPADLFSLGTTLYAAVEGRSPFQRADPLTTLHAIVTEDPPPAAHAGPLAPLLAALLRKDPAARPAPGEVRAALEEVARTGGSATASRAADTRTADTAAPTPTRTFPAPHPPSPTPTRSLAQPPMGAARRTRGVRVHRRVLALVAVLAASIAVVVAGIAIVPRFTGGGGGPGGTAGRAAATDGPFDPGHGPVPADWVRYTSPTEGWSVATPSWTPQPAGGFVRLRKPGYGYVAVGTRPGPVSPRGLVESLAGSFGASQPAYRNLGMRDLRFRGRDATDWEFTYRDAGADLHAVVRGFVLDGTGYLVWFQTKTSDWARAQDERAAMLASFRP